MYVDGVATRCGVFEYLQPDGSIVRELRDDADVLAAESLGTLGRKPVTLDHPVDNLGRRRLVTPETYKADAVGAVGELVQTTEGGYVVVSLAVMRADALEAIEAGTHELSCGYVCDVDKTAGVHPIYGAYDQRQINISYNHLAIVERGRAGESARLRMDAADQVQPSDTSKERTMAKVKIGKQEYDVPAELEAPIRALIRADSEEEDVWVKLDAMQQKMDELHGRADADASRLQDYEDKLSKLMEVLARQVRDGLLEDEIIDAMPEAERKEFEGEEGQRQRMDARDKREREIYERRARLTQAAKALRVDGSDALSNRELEVKVASAYLKRDLRADEASNPHYLRGVISAACADAERNAARGVGATILSGRTEQRADSTEDARRRYEERIRAASKKG